MIIKLNSNTVFFLLGYICCPFSEKQFKELVHRNNCVLIAEEMEKNVSAAISVIILNSSIFHCQQLLLLVC